MMKGKLFSDPRWHEDPGFVDVLCNSCKHYQGDCKCDAYPDGIPRPLLLDVKHDHDYPGDHGIHFESKE